MKEVLIFSNKRKLYLNMFGYLISAVASICIFIYRFVICALFTDSHSYLTRLIFGNEWTWKIFGIFMLIASIICIKQTAISISKPIELIIKLNSEGFETAKYGFVKWTNVSRLDLDKIEGSSYITFDIKEGILANKKSTAIFSNPYVIELFYTGINASKLYNIMQQYLSQHKSSLSTYCSKGSKIEIPSIFFKILSNLAIIGIGLLLYLILRFHSIGSHEYFKIEVGATAKNFSSKYITLFTTVDKNNDGTLSHSEILDFYNNANVYSDDYSTKLFRYGNGEWLVNSRLRDAALEYYTNGRIVTPELDEKYGRYFVGINSGINNN